MKLLTCLITHNRPELTKLTLESYLNSTASENFLVVVDNASEYETVSYLESMKDYIDILFFSVENLYPGKACNVGWKMGLEVYPQADYLHRSDNDIFYQINWDLYTERVFNDISSLGQFGILDLKDQHFPGTAPSILLSGSVHDVNTFYPNIGGNHVIRRILWDKGLRHVEETWDTVGDEDVRFSQDVAKLKYKYGHSVEHIATHLGVWNGYFGSKDYKEYYRRTYMQRLGRDIYVN